MVTALRLIGPLLAFVLLMGGLALSYSPKPAQSPPNRLERTCRIYSERDPDMMAHAPCFIVDEYLQPQWNV
jgi:hypothetical protein